MGPSDLAQVLRPLMKFDHPDLIVGLKTADDAAVYRLNDEQAIILTIDFFTPVVDDPYDYGAIAAANSMSDVYAMGGEVLLALNVAGFPDDVSKDVLIRIFEGGADKVREAEAIIAGGHTIVDKEPKYGLSVTGIVHPERVTTKAGARPGDALVLTKPLGTGLVTTALKQGRANPDDLEAAVASMKRLNRDAARAVATAGGIKGVTDITGFGLLGHGSEMADASGVGLRIQAEAVPLLPGALDYAAAGCIPGGASRNREFLTGDELEPVVSWREGVDERVIEVLFNPETSGGLLIAVPPARLAVLERELRRVEQPYWVIGEAVEGKGIVVE